MKQRDVFLQTEADAWYLRNKGALAKKDFATADTVSASVLEIARHASRVGNEPLKILEVGCGDGGRLAWLADQIGAETYGVEPSAIAVDNACSVGVKALRGTAESLPFEDRVFDIVIFGFCLYLCDRGDLFRVAQEADRVLKDDAWLVLNDFYTPAPICREYHHRPGVFSYKMDYRKLFDWHPAYTTFSHKVMAHGGDEFTDESNEWVATSVIRKKAAVDV